MTMTMTTNMHDDDGELLAEGKPLIANRPIHVTFLYYIAEFLEDVAEDRAKRSIKSLVEIAPDTARVKVGDKEEIRNVDEVNIGDIVIVKPGDKVPLDGESYFRFIFNQSGFHHW